jgi:hypothetical protein
LRASGRFLRGKLLRLLHHLAEERNITLLDGDVPHEFLQQDKLPPCMPNKPTVAPSDERTKKIDYFNAGLGDLDWLIARAAQDRSGGFPRLFD